MIGLITTALIDQTRSSPDRSAVGFVEASVDALRYDGHTLDPDEAAGVLASFVPTGARVLDVGCGTGSVARILADTRDANVIGVEPDESRASVAAARGVDVRAGVLSEAIVKELGQFDVVLFADVLEHLAEPVPLLLLAREALKPDGAVIASVPNVAHWSVRMELLIRGRFRYEATGIMDATHLRWFDTVNLRMMFHAAGMQIVQWGTTAGFGLANYTARRPWKWVPQRTRENFVRRAHKRWPGLFACQYVVKAVTVAPAPAAQPPPQP